MTKPIGFYTNYIPGEGGVLSDIEEALGSYFEQIRDNEKLWLIARIANDLSLKYPIDKPPSENMERAAHRANEISVSNRIGLIHALIAQTHWVG